ncbi:amidohydrolase [Rhodohalobacter sp.]|uniref:amidohydrolase n=1 Tax=Rhodohalobacter sp. TaxID=1974210 RepID=UPI002ACDC7DF|nr:amidohydrolase [Rhodohalobacter sp.]MDZ7756603.1 amidohydrolase [Rhodohalobacter sp.]
MNRDELVRLRKELHRNPELSGRESETADRIIKELKRCNPDELLTGLGGSGIAAKFSGAKDSLKTILIRAELDAIAVREETDLNYSSQNNGVMHGCGHDGHMTILLGVARKLAEERSANKTVWLLFQPAEETGEGAEWVLKDSKFEVVQPDVAYALHNLPGYPENQIVVKKGVFAAASIGVQVKFKGKSSHAAYPEQGVNPSREISDLVQFANLEFDDFKSKSSINKIVTTYISLGERAFGISPGEGEVGFTIRSSSDEELSGAVNKLRDKVHSLMEIFEGDISFDRVEPFAATVNDPEGVESVIAAAEKSGLNLKELDTPFPWSEDFGSFGRRCPITLFGLGTGEDHPPLHSEMYDFNDELIQAGVKMFTNLIER